MAETRASVFADFVKAANGMTSAVQHAVVQASVGIQRAARVLALSLSRFVPHALASARAEYGGNGADAYAYPGAWMSTVCGAWLCRGGDVCPSDEHGLRCTCACHRQER